MHIGFEEFVRTRIPAFRGRDERNNRLVLETIALQGPLIKYDIFKALKSRDVKHYPTISRRVDDLKKKGYIDAAGKRVITVGKRAEESPTYGLTWRGLIASLAADEVARKVPIVLKNNPLLKIPFPKGMIINVLNEIFTPRETEVVVHALLEGFLRAIPRDIESIEQEKYIAYLIPAMAETPEIREKFEGKDLTKLYRIPGLLEYVMDLINASERQLTDVLAAVQGMKKGLSAYIQATQKMGIERKASS